ncbi:MAG: hypothetical protein KBF57_00520 [Saprospiraceae bacterium]|jgi:hypothetical protein|nr:hypothetical protein [Saprospiraceae bacterium]
MKVTKFLVAGLLTFSAFITNAKDIDPNLTERVRNEVAKHLLKAEWQNTEKKSFLITFVVNSNGEVLVSSTSDRELDGKIKDLLNYKKISTDGLKPFEVYTLPVTLQ